MFIILARDQSPHPYRSIITNTVVIEPRHLGHAILAGHTRFQQIETDPFGNGCIYPSNDPLVGFAQEAIALALVVNVKMRGELRLLFNACSTDDRAIGFREIGMSNDESVISSVADLCDKSQIMWLYFTPLSGIPSAQFLRAMMTRLSAIFNHAALRTWVMTGGDDRLHALFAGFATRTRIYREDIPWVEMCLNFNWPELTDPLIRNMRGDVEGYAKSNLFLTYEPRALTPSAMGIIPLNGSYHVTIRQMLKRENLSRGQCQIESDWFFYASVTSGNLHFIRLFEREYTPSSFEVVAIIGHAMHSPITMRDAIFSALANIISQDADAFVGYIYNTNSYEAATIAREVCSEDALCAVVARNDYACWIHAIQQRKWAACTFFAELFPIAPIRVNMELFAFKQCITSNTIAQYVATNEWAVVEFVCMHTTLNLHHVLPTIRLMEIHDGEEQFKEIMRKRALHDDAHFKRFNIRQYLANGDSCATSDIPKCSGTPLNLSNPLNA